MDDPIERFSAWLQTAKQHPAILEPTAMSLATADERGRPSVRIVLLKAVDARGFSFYTNLEGRKSRELKENPQAALCFYWAALERQVRVEGQVEAVSTDEADAYFASRPRISQIGAWASRQSEELASREALMQAVAEFTAKFEGQVIPRPPHWSGWRVVPRAIEFWQQGAFRLHEREVYERDGDGWNTALLYP